MQSLNVGVAVFLVILQCTLSSAFYHDGLENSAGAGRFLLCGSYITMYMIDRKRPRCIVAFLLLCLATEISLTDAAVDTCETPGVNAFVKDNPVKAETVARRTRSEITKDVVEEAFKSCKETLIRRRDLDIKLAKRGRVIKPGQRKADLSLMKKIDPLIKAKETGQLPFEEVSYQLYKRYNLSRDDVTNDLPAVPMDGKLSRAARNTCRQTMMTARYCDANSPYRTANGQCNNLQNPIWGSAFSCQQRLLQANYLGISGFRVSVDGTPLPPPRILSRNLHYHYNRPSNYLTHMYAFFGQLLDHDIAGTVPSTTENNEAIQCCPPERESHPQCAPILVPSNDPFYSQFGVTCLNFVRSAICATCALGPREQMNDVTSFIDASFVYGNSENQTRSLRANDGTGRLRIQRSRYGDLLPPRTNPSTNPSQDRCSFSERNEACFAAGDSRVNQHTILASLHTIFLREHNRIANGLRLMNPRWRDERLFQEARRILGAIMQIITYKEYLPITLGEESMTYFKLWSGNPTSYNPEHNPTMFTEFTTAAFRWGHTSVNSVVTNAPLNDSNGLRLLRNEFFQPFDLYRGYAGPLLRGASFSPAQWFDRHFVPDLTNYLYRIRRNQTGLDLAAININRGRDHGIPTYVDMVRFCSEGEVVIRSFSDLVSKSLMRYQQAYDFQRTYRYVEDIELYSGILLEDAIDGAAVGPTGACIIGLQFHALKYGDRFYVDHVNQAGSFTDEQLTELRSITLSQIICLNTNVDDLPLNALIFPSGENPIINCRSVTGIDLSYWRE